MRPPSRSSTPAPTPSCSVSSTSTRSPASPTQVFEEVDRPRRLVYRELLDVPPSPLYESIITETFTERDGGTLLAFHHVGFPSEQERDLHKQGYEIIFDRLERHFARSP